MEEQFPSSERQPGFAQTSKAPAAGASAGVMVAIAVSVTIILWASAFVGIRASLTDYSPLHLAALRYLIASIILVPIAAVRRIRLPRVSEVPQFALIGIVGFAVYNIALNAGERSVSAASACFIVNTGTAITAVISVVFLKETVRPLGWAGILVSLLGVGLIAFGDKGGGFSFDTGTLYVLISALCQSIYFTSQKPFLAIYSSLEVVCYTMWLGTIAMLPGLFGIGDEIRNASLASTLSVVYLGVFPAVIAYFCWIYVLSLIPVSRAATYLYIVPLVSIVIGYFWLNEIPGPIALFGGFIVLLGVFVVNRYGLGKIVAGGDKRS
jgi:drug/metabolite transporter (DMT)-like permease